MPDKSNLSIFKNWKRYIPHLSFLILLVASLYLGYLYFFQGKPTGQPDYMEDYSKPAPLANLPEYLRLENLETIEGLSTMEYLRVLRLKYYYEGDKDSEKKTIQELELKYPGERGRVLSRLLGLFIQWEDYTRKLSENEELDGYQRKLQSLQKRKELFGEEAESFLYPNADPDKLEIFQLYTKRYIKKHREDEISEIRDHLQKAKREIYGENFERIQEQETFDSRLELELLLQERELSISTEEERRIRIAKIKRSVIKNLP
jgi:hypothetical protein